MRLLTLLLLVTGFLGVHARVSTTSHALEVLELRQYRGGWDGKVSSIVSTVEVQPAQSMDKPTTVVDVTLAVTLTPPVLTVTSTTLVSTDISSPSSSSDTTTSSTSTSTTSIDFFLAIASTTSAWTAVSTFSSLPSTSTTASATTSTNSNTKLVVTDYTTVKWYESWVGGTYSTWFPTTIEVHPAPMSPAPRPGKGEVGMGTLTGELGVTQTIVMGAAASQAPRWVEGVAAVVGIGVVGALV